MKIFRKSSKKLLFPEVSANKKEHQDEVNYKEFKSSFFDEGITLLK